MNEPPRHPLTYPSMHASIYPSLGLKSSNVEGTDLTSEKTFESGIRGQNQVSAVTV